MHEYAAGPGRPKILIKKMQTTSHILMIRPVQFGFNPETAVNNSFQLGSGGKDVQEKAVAEFDRLVALLRSHSVDVMVIEDSPHPHTPDSIFPNNWISFHENGTICLYPMFAPNRRRERKPQVLEKLAQNYRILQMLDMSHLEEDGLFLEGTGSMVLDRDNQLAYACLSPRTDPETLNRFCRKMKYTAVPFRAVDAQGQAIYHTNVMMCVTTSAVVICLDSIPSQQERENIEQHIRESGKEILPISMRQMEQFAGNMLQVENERGEKLLVMSSRSYGSLSTEQLNLLGELGRIIHSPLDTIEDNGGGSARCMMAEIFLPLKNEEPEKQKSFQ